MSELNDTVQIESINFNLTGNSPIFDYLPVFVSDFISNINNNLSNINNFESNNISEIINYSKDRFQDFTNKVAINLYNLPVFTYNDETKDSILSEYLKPEFFTFFIIISIAVTLVIIGSYSTIEKPKNALNPNVDHPLFDPMDNEITFNYEEIPKIDGKAVVLLPILGTVTILGLYYGVNKLNLQDLNYYLNHYFLFMGLNSNFFTINYLTKLIIRKFCYFFNLKSINFFKKYKLTISDDTKYLPSGFENNYLLPEFTKEEKIIKEEKLSESRDEVLIKDQTFNFYFSKIDFNSILLSILLCSIYYFFNGSKNWILSNSLAFTNSIFGIKSTKLSSFAPAIFLLSAFFFYDIYFVFRSDVMMTVATSIDIPAKILIPNSSLNSTNITELDKIKELSYSMLGLGDIVLPSMLMSLCLRFDLYNFHEANPNTEFYHNRSYPKPYFTTIILSYITALIATVTVLYKYKHGQPALLYISPSLIFCLILTSLRRGEFKKMINFSENVDKDEPTLTDIICSEETLFLSGKIQEEDIDDVEDNDYIPTDIDDEEEEFDDEDDDENTIDLDFEEDEIILEVIEDEEESD